MMGQDAIFSCDVDEVGANAQGKQVQVIVNRGHRQSNRADETGEEFERHTSS